MPGFKLTPDRYPTITRQTKNNNAHAALDFVTSCHCTWAAKT